LAGDLEGLDAADIADIFADVPSSQVAHTALAGDGLALVDLLAESGLASSKGTRAARFRAAASISIICASPTRMNWLRSIRPSKAASWCCAKGANSTTWCSF
jgi:hypothetical protein